MRLLISCIFFLTMLSCNRDFKNGYILDFGTFQLKVPSGWKKIPQQGVDSYVGGLTNGADTLWFDYGRYKVNLHQGEFSNKIVIDTINGLRGEFAIPADSSKGYLSLYIEQVNKGSQFSIYGQNFSNKELILTILKSLVFKESNTSKNPALTQERLSKIQGASGEDLFKYNCSSCHRILEDFTGPSLYNSFSKRNKDWVFIFLSYREKVTKDSIYIKLKQEYKFDCKKFPNISREEVYAIYNYCL